LPYSKSVWMLPAPQLQPLKPPATQAIWMFEPDLHRMRSCAWQMLGMCDKSQDKLRERHFIVSQFIFGLSATQWRSLFIMQHYDVVIIFVENQWYNDTSPEYCFSLRAATRLMSLQSVFLTTISKT
jgi:hypothetical protein